MKLSGKIDNFFVASVPRNNKCDHSTVFLELFSIFLVIILCNY